MEGKKKKQSVEFAKDKNTFAGGSSTKRDSDTKKAKQKQSGAHQPRDADVTSGHDVQKLGQEENPETEESVADAPTPYPVENARHNYAVDNGNPQGLKLTAGMADKPVQRASLKEKLEAFKVKAAGGDAEKAMPKKAKEKTETL